MEAVARRHYGSTRDLDMVNIGNISASDNGGVPTFVFARWQRPTKLTTKAFSYTPRRMAELATEGTNGQRKESKWPGPNRARVMQF